MYSRKKLEWFCHTKKRNEDYQMKTYLKMEKKGCQMNAERQKAGLHLHSPAGCCPRTGHSFAWCVPPLKTGRLQSEKKKKINK